MPTTKIGKLLNISSTCISNVIKRNGIKPRNISQSKKGIKKGTKFPVDDIILLYESNKTSDEIAKIYNTTKRTILNILKDNNIKRRKSGWKDGYQNPLTTIIKDLYIEGLSINEIVKQTGMSYGGINKILTKLNLNRTNFKHKGMLGKQHSVDALKKISSTKIHRKHIGLYDHIYLKRTGYTYNEFQKKLPDFKKYYERVRYFTENQPISNLKNFKKRGKVGELNSYNLDHKFSVIEGFRNNIPPYIIGNINNLEMIPWEENIIKQGECSITIDELISLIYSNNIRN